MKNVTICISTFERPDRCQTAINSIRKLYPGVAILIADDSRKPLDFENAITYKYPFDKGLSFKRNDLIKKVKTDYLVIMDDDQVMTQPGCLEILHDILKQSDIEICATKLKEPNGFIFYHGFINIIDGILVYSKGYKGQVEPGYVESTTSKGVFYTTYTAEIVPNLFMAKRKVFNKIQWDEQLKLAEHADFFLQAKQKKVKIAYTADVYFEHIRGAQASNYYNKMRSRSKEYLAMSAKKWNYYAIKPFTGDIRIIISETKG